jgi:S-adenosylmethionine:tRNA ribosyltransferase-isomerase
MKDKILDINSFYYDLTNERIAKYPLENRHDSNLLIYKNNDIQHTKFKHVSDFIESDTLLIGNNTKVIQARLLFEKATGASIEIFCLSPVEPADYYLVFNSEATCSWLCIIGNKKKWKGEVLQKILVYDGNSICLEAELVDSEKNRVEFRWDSEVPFSTILELAGNMPIPPYLNRKSEESDKKSYQTVYAQHNGSVAAPTAGLHFTESVFKQLEQKNVVFKGVTLHVGAGTFQPVKEDNALNHPMHTEYCEVSKDILKALLQYRDKVIAIGTTATRTLESLYWLGVQLIQNETFEDQVFEIEQYAYTCLPQNIEPKECLDAILNFVNENKLNEIRFTTSIMIVPGYDFRMINGLLTNFHQPKSTLLLLIAALVGDNWKTIYNYALENNFRFLSYGDSSLLYR